MAISRELVTLTRWSRRTSLYSSTIWLWIYTFLMLIVKGSFVHFSEFQFTVEPTDVVTNRGGEAMLNCAAEHGHKTPHIYWKKDHERLYLDQDTRREQLTNGSLHIKKVTHTKSDVGDVGLYQCLAEVADLGIIVSRPAHIQIAHMTKTFSIEPETLKVYLGDIAMFQCAIDGIPEPTYTWYKDDVQLVQTEHIKIYPDGYLEIQDVQFMHMGEYVCEASNMNRSRRSRPATLLQNADLKSIEQGVEPHFVMQPKDVKAVRGTSVVLHCGANGRNRNREPPTITWLKGGVTLDYTNRTYEVVGTGSLLISHVEETNNGIYTCRASNMEDSIDAQATVTVLVPPEFKKKPKNVFAHVTSEVTLECDIYGVPTPEIFWMKDGKKIIADDYFQIVDHKNLRILGLLERDQGLYQCFGSNDLGSVQASAQLVILQKSLSNLNLDTLPSAPTHLQEAILSTSFVTLSWKPPENKGPDSDEIIAYSVYWKEKGKERERVMNTTNTEATIQLLKPNTVYEFQVLAYNRYGPGKAATLLVTSKQEVRVPSPPQNAQAIARSSTSILIKYEAPKEPNGQIKFYKIIYYEVGANKEADINVESLNYILKGLKQFREYSFRVEAHNENGAGLSTEEFVARTLPAPPSAPPSNFTLETTSSTSIIVRWEPPPIDEQNGIIVGYKIRYKKKGQRRGDTAPTAGNRKFYALTGLEKGTEYSVRIAALTVEGTGPSTEWQSAMTYKDDLDESQVPGKPARIRTQAEANSIMVRWSPPSEESKILVRGYILTYGRGIPDVLQVNLDAQQRIYTIKDLQPSSQYIIKVKAFNNMGEGQPIYAIEKTSEESATELATPMMPPVGLKTIVLSSQTIVLTWTDSTLSRAQRITDNRYYTVRYAPVYNNRKFKYINSTDLNAHIDELKPNTQYEFSVKVTKNLRKSTWSMSVVNTTQEAAPGGVPRDLTPATVDSNPLSVTLSWQPPQRPNGQLTGYLIFYTTDSHQEDRDWVVHNVDGDKLSATIKDLTPDTTYFFKMQARNNKGYGPMSPTVVYRTSKGGNKKANQGGKEETVPTNMMIIIIACVVGVSFCIIVVVVAIVICKRREYRNKRSSGNYMSPAKGKTTKAPTPKDVKPPDLWIHHDHVEMKNLDKSDTRDPSAPPPPAQRNPECSKGEEMPPGMDIEKRRNSFVGDSSYLSPASDERYPRSIIRPKPMMIPVDPTQPISREFPNGHLQGAESPQSQVAVRPVYPRTQYNTQYSTPPRVHAGDVTQPSSMKPQQSTSPYKRPNPPVSSGPIKPRSPMPIVTPKAPDVTLKSGKEETDMQKSLSTEELTAEMANLEGLMKDLNAITQQEFEC